MINTCKLNPCCGDMYLCTPPRQHDGSYWEGDRWHNLPKKEEAAPHPDDAAVDRFAAAMKAKLAKKRADGRGGWERKDECSAEFLSDLLRGHVEKGDPLDVGNLAMMLHQRGERIA